MRLLGVLGLGFEDPDLPGHVLGAVALFDDVTDFADRDVCQRDRIGTHISNESDITFARQLDAFIEALRDPHRPLRVEAKLA